MNTAWFDEEDQQRTRTREREPEDEPIDLEPTSMVRHVDEDLAGLAALARQDGPRDLKRILAEAREVGAALGAILDKPVGSRPAEGTAAYYRWTVGKGDRASVIEGPTVGMMDALAGIWGGIVYSVRMVEQRGQYVTLRGRVLDVLRVVAHERDYMGWLRPAPAGFAGEEAGRWLTMQMQAAESKAIRGVLEHVIPTVVTEAAMESARDAAAATRLGGRTLEEGVRKSLEALAKVGVTDVAILTRWVGRPPQQWTALDLGSLRDLYQRAKRGELPPDALRVEAAQREAGRAAEEQPDPTSTATGDRLAGLGLGKPTPTPTVPTPSPTSVTPSTPPIDQAPAAERTVSGPVTDAGQAGKTPTPKPDPVKEAELLRDRIVAGGRWPVAAMAARAWLREALGIARMSDDRYNAAIADGEKRRFWVVNGTGDLFPAPPATTTSIPGPDPWDDPGEPTGDELQTAIEDCEADLTVEEIEEAARVAGLDIGADGPVIEDVPESGLRRYLAALRERVTL